MIEFPVQKSETVKTLVELQAECASLAIRVEADGRASKQPFVTALRDHFWYKDHPGRPLPAQVTPMLLSDWTDLTHDQAQEIERDNHSWIVQAKRDGVRGLLHIEESRVRITSRCVSEVTYRLSERQDNLPHLATGLSKLTGAILDGELVCPTATLDTGSCTTAHPLQAVVAILATDPENARHVQERHQARLISLFRCPQTPRSGHDRTPPLQTGESPSAGHRSG